ncbi:MAG: DUF4386 domain-containing protein [Acidimicrobiaceae bacterium]|nr:DUF4386 domain-containing protein [Acidimicrobiaceae bacterium]
MSAISAQSPPTPAPEANLRRRAQLAGILYLVTFVASAPVLPLENVALKHADFIVSAGSNARLALGGVFNLINGLAAVGTAVALYPLLRRRHPGLALGLVTSRLLEGATIVTSTVAVLSLVTLHDPAARGAGRTALVAVGMALIALHKWTFLLGPGLMSAINALLLGTMLYKSGLVPRIIPTIGLIGAPILLASVAAAVFGAYDQDSAASLLASLPVAVWELSLALWLTIRGPRPEALL